MSGKRATPALPNGASSGAVRPELPATVSRDARKQAVVDTIKATGLTTRQAGLSCQIATSVLYEWLDSDPAFRQAIAEAEAIFERRMSIVIVSTAAEFRSWRAALAILSRRFPDRWSERSRLDVNVDRQDLEDEFAKLPEAELQARMSDVIAEIVRRAGPDEIARIEAAVADRRAAT